MEWTRQLKQALPRDEIPAFLQELQALVKALRDGDAWEDRVTARLRAHPELVLSYLQPGSRRNAVARLLEAK